jgi:hypothetical protein
MTRVLGGFAVVALAFLLLLSAFPAAPATAPALEAPPVVQGAQVAMREALTADGGFCVYDGAAAVAVPETVVCSNGLRIRNRADGHIVEKHGEATLRWMQNKPVVEVWYRDTPRDEAYCVLFAGDQGNMALGLYLGARGDGSIDSFRFDALEDRLIVTGWIMELRRWHNNLARDGYVCVWTSSGGAVAG